MHTPPNADFRKSPIAIAVSETEAAEALGMSVHFLRKDRQTKRLIPFFKVGGRVLYSPDRVREALEKFELGGAPEPTRRPRRS